MLIIVLALLFSKEITEGQNLFTGSQIKMDLATKQADVIFIGNIEEIQGPGMDAFGLPFYAAKIQITDVLKGKVAPEVWLSLIASMFTKPRETPPVVHQKYVFFGKTDELSTGVDIRTLKLLPADDATVAKVKQLIAAASAPSPH